MIMIMRKLKPPLVISKRNGFKDEEGHQEGRIRGHQVGIL